MRRLKTFMMIGVILLSGLLNLTGCSKRYSEKELKEIVQVALENKYQEEFICLDVWSSGGEGFQSVCYPKSNRDLLFETICLKDGNLVRDGYAASIVSKEFSEKFDNEVGSSLGTHFTYCNNAGNMYDDVTAEKISNGEFTLDYFFSTRLETHNNNELELYYTICFDTSGAGQLSFGDEYDEIINALENIKENANTEYGIELSYRMNLYFVPKDIYDDCIDYFEKNAEIRSVFQDMIEGYPVRKFNRLIKFDVGLNIFPITKDEYINQREEVN